MEKQSVYRVHYRSFIWFIGMFSCLVSLVGAPIVGSWIPYDFSFHRQADPLTRQTLKELNELGILEHAPKGAVTALVDFRRTSGKSLAQILRYPIWSKRLGLTADTYKATWYVSNPFDILPSKLQDAIRKKKIPFKSRMHVWQWARANRVPQKWRKALYLALVETTPHNLWRASRGKKSYAKNGQYLQPIVVEKEDGQYIVNHGHIATDPNFIPTNSDVLVVLQVQGVDHIIKVKAADIGGAIRGKHVDLPIHLGPQTVKLPETKLPREHIRNPTVRILTPIKSNPNQKA